MILDLQVEPREHLEIRVNGKVAVDICVSALTLIEPEMLGAARANSALRHIVAALIDTFTEVAEGRVADHSVTAKNRLEILLQGFRDGLAGKTVKHPCDGDRPVIDIPPILPQAGKTYAIGYHHATGVKNAYKQASLLDGQEAVNESALT